MNITTMELCQNSKTHFQDVCTASQLAPRSRPARSEYSRLQIFSKRHLSDTLLSN